MRKRPLRRPQLHRPPLHRVAAVLVVPLTAAVLAGCAQVVHGHPNTASAGPIGSVGLVDRLRAGTAKITSNHIDLRLDVAGQSIVASGDEKISGSFHFTPGNSYEECPNGNRSAIHWDLVLIQTPAYGGGDMYFDDVLVRRDGRFVLPELECLNPENLK